MPGISRYFGVPKSRHLSKVLALVVDQAGDAVSIAFATSVPY